mgnify:CR=1 FL=1
MMLTIRYIEMTKDLRDPEQMATTSDTNHIKYLKSKCCNVTYDIGGVLVRLNIYSGKVLTVKSIRRETLEQCVNAFNKNEWDV